MTLKVAVQTNGCRAREVLRKRIIIELFGIITFKSFNRITDMYFLIDGILFFGVVSSFVQGDAVDINDMSKNII
jgi:hypothetical protein